LTIKEIIDVARELVVTLKIPFQDVVAVGHSMGSLIVSGLASREKLAGVVFIGPIYPSAALSKIFTERIDTVTKGSRRFMIRSR
jgi:alpha-beta hydrolase superfamily lysophospholipase